MKHEQNNFLVVVEREIVDKYDIRIYITFCYLDKSSIPDKTIPFLIIIFSYNKENNIWNLVKSNIVYNINPGSHSYLTYLISISKTTKSIFDIIKLVKTYSPEKIKQFKSMLFIGSKYDGIRLFLELYDLFPENDKILYKNKISQFLYLISNKLS